MNISRLQYNEKYQALEIYLSGCDGVCLGCHNEELWDFNVGTDIIYNSNITNIINKSKSGMVQHIWILGGEPLLQNIDDLEYLLWIIKESVNCFIWLWTRFYEKDIPDNIKQYLSYVKVGEYQKDSESYIDPLFEIKLASKNQRIIKL